MKIPRTLIEYNKAKGRKKEEVERLKKERKEQERIVREEQGNSTVISADKYWTIENVNYMGDVKTYQLLKELMPSGTQEQHAQRYFAVGGKEFHCADAPLNYAIFRSLSHSKDSAEKENARKFLQKSMRNNYPVTLTRIKYGPSGDNVFHNYHVAGREYDRIAKIVGQDKKIGANDTKALEAILLTDDVEEIRETLNWINKTPVYIWRVNSTPSAIDERVVRFYAVTDRVYLYCYWDPSDSDPCFGVREA